METKPWNEARADWERDGLLFEVRDHVAWLTLNRPEQRNAMHKPLRRAVIEAAAEIADDPEIRAAVITGAGTAFSSGADIIGQDPVELDPDRRRGSHSNVAHEDGLRYGWWRMVAAIWENPKPFVAAVNGPAVGGGCQLALACDFVLLSADGWLQEIFVNRGLPLEAGAAYLLPRAIGIYRAKEIALFGDRVGAEDAVAWGLANRVVPATELTKVAEDWAGRLVQRPAISLSHIKQQLNAGMDESLRQTFRNEVAFLGLGGGEDQREAFRAFAERRPPNYTGQ